MSKRHQSNQTQQEANQDTQQTPKEPCFYPHELKNSDGFYKYRYLLALLDKDKKYTKQEAIQTINERKK